MTTRILIEAFLNSSKQKTMSNKKAVLELFANPTSDELRKIADTTNDDFVRALVDTTNKKIYAFRGDFYHDTAVEVLSDYSWELNKTTIEDFNIIFATIIYEKKDNFWYIITGSDEEDKQVKTWAEKGSIKVG